MKRESRAERLLALLAEIDEIESIDKLQAVVYLWQKLASSLKSYPYSVDFIGPFSPELRTDAFLLMEMGLIEDTGGPHTIRLTNRGREYVEGQKLLMKYQRALEPVKKVKRDFAHLTLSEVRKISSYTSFALNDDMRSANAIGRSGTNTILESELKFRYPRLN